MGGKQHWFNARVKAVKKDGSTGYITYRKITNYDRFMAFLDTNHNWECVHLYHYISREYFKTIRNPKI